MSIKVVNDTKRVIPATEMKSNSFAIIDRAPVGWTPERGHIVYKNVDGSELNFIETHTRCSANQTGLNVIPIDNITITLS